MKRLMILTACACLTGCFSFLKPAPDNARHFVLTPLPASEAAPASSASSAGVSVGVIYVKVPAYLFNSSLAVRKGVNEIDYSPTALWAERPDTAIPRVLVADLSALLPREQVRLSVGRGEEVATQISVNIEQFDVSSGGQGVLVAQWDILASSGEKTLRSGESRLTREGPAPQANASGAIGTLSGLLADLSRQLAQALKETTPALAHE